MRCPRCSAPLPIPPAAIAPFSGAIERLWACACGWWRLDFLGWAERETVQMAFGFLMEMA